MLPGSAPVFIVGWPGEWWNGLVIAVDAQGTIQALEANTGKLRWRRTGEAYSAPNTSTHVPVGPHSYRSVDGLVRSPTPISDDRGRVVIA